MIDQLYSNIGHIAMFIGILFATVILAFLVNRFFKHFISRSTQEMKSDPTNYLFLRHVITVIIYILGFSVAIYTMPNLKALASSLLAGAGILAVAVGFASQQALSNVVSGIFIVIFKPFRVYDRINIRGMTGIIEDISLRHTIIRDFENKRIIVPNSVVSDEIIINSDYGDSAICKMIDVGISYESDVAKARLIIKDEILKHSFHIDGRTPNQIDIGDELAPVRVVSFGDSSINLRGWAWAQDSKNAFIMGCDLLESIKNRFDAEGVEIPYTHITLVNKNYNTVEKKP